MKALGSTGNFAASPRMVPADLAGNPFGAVEDPASLNKKPEKLMPEDLFTMNSEEEPPRSGGGIDSDDLELVDGGDWCTTGRGNGKGG